jgi:hypothetical protein
VSEPATVSRVAVLRARRPMLRLLGMIRPLRRTFHQHTTAQFWVVLLISVALAMLAAAGLVWSAQDLAWPLFYLTLFAAFVLPIVLWVTLTIVTSWWWMAGAGLPVLEVADGEIRGRLRPVYADESASASVDVPDWWDLRLPAASVRAVRVASGTMVGPALVLDLPPELERSLVAHPEVSSAVSQTRHRVGAPAAWWLGMYEPRRRRRAQLRMLLSALEANGAPRS